MQNKDNDMDNVIDRSENIHARAEFYAGQLTTQLKKGLLSYSVLLACEELTYTSEVIKKLNLAEIDVAEGTVYPLLARLQKDGLLEHRWRESYQGPPRKYYVVTDYGRAVRKVISGNIKVLNNAIKKLERGKP